MKIRADFVTNSSSSSYVKIDLECPMLADMLWDYEDLLAGYMLVLGYHVVTESSCFDSSDVPKSKGEVMKAFREGLANASQRWDKRSRDRIKPLLDSLESGEKDFEKSIDSVSWTYSESGYGEGWGDEGGEAFCKLSDKDREKLRLDVAEENECPPEDVSGQMIYEYILSSSFVETWLFKYKKGGRAKYSHTFEIQ